MIVPLKYLVQNYSLIISAVTIVSSYAFWMRVCLCYLFADWCDRACMWGVYLCKSACHNWGAPAGVFMDRQPFFHPFVSISLWDLTPSFCRSLCEICSPLICCVNPPWVAAVVSSSLIDSNPSFFLTLSFCLCVCYLSSDSRRPSSSQSVHPEVREPKWEMGCWTA